MPWYSMAWRVIFPVVALLAGAARGQINTNFLHVAPDGNATATQCRLAPYCTLGRALELAKEKDHIYVMAGHYYYKEIFYITLRDVSIFGRTETDVTGPTVIHVDNNSTDTALDCFALYFSVHPFETRRLRLANLTFAANNTAWSGGDAAAYANATWRRCALPVVSFAAEEVDVAALRANRTGLPPPSAWPEIELSNVRFSHVDVVGDALGNVTWHGDDGRRAAAANATRGRRGPANITLHFAESSNEMLDVNVSDTVGVQLESVTFEYINCTSTSFDFTREWAVVDIRYLPLASAVYGANASVAMRAHGVYLSNVWLMHVDLPLAASDTLSLLLTATAANNTVINMLIEGITWLSPRVGVRLYPGAQFNATEVVATCTDTHPSVSPLFEVTNAHEADLLTGKHNGTYLCAFSADGSPRATRIAFTYSDVETSCNGFLSVVWVFCDLHITMESNFFESYYRHKVTTAGSAVDVQSFNTGAANVQAPSRIYFTSINDQFNDCQGDRGGCLAFSIGSQMCMTNNEAKCYTRLFPPTLYATVQNAHFVRPFVTRRGAAISMRTSVEFKYLRPYNSHAWPCPSLAVLDSSFVDGGAVLSGGAIFLDNASPDFVSEQGHQAVLLRLELDRCFAYNNYAGVSGGFLEVSASNTYTRIANSRIVTGLELGAGGKRSYGQSALGLYQGDAVAAGQHANVLGAAVYAERGALLEIFNCTFALRDNILPFMLMGVRNYIDTQGLDCDNALFFNQTTFTCDTGFFPDMNVVLTGDTGSECGAVITSHCTPCASGLGLNPGEFYLPSGLNTSLKCAPCPQGAKCNRGYASALAGFWSNAGFFTNTTPIDDFEFHPERLHFYPCPQGFCDGSGEDGCTANRTDVLCSECKEGYIRVHRSGVRSTVCLLASEAQCGHTHWLYYVGIGVAFFLYFGGIYAFQSNKQSGLVRSIIFFGNMWLIIDSLHPIAYSDVVYSNGERVHERNAVLRALSALRAVVTEILNVQLAWLLNSCPESARAALWDAFFVPLLAMLCVAVATTTAGALHRRVGARRFFFWKSFGTVRRRTLTQEQQKYQQRHREGEEEGAEEEEEEEQLLFSVSSSTGATAAAVLDGVDGSLDGVDRHRSRQNVLREAASKSDSSIPRTVFSLNNAADLPLDEEGGGGVAAAGEEEVLEIDLEEDDDDDDDDDGDKDESDALIARSEVDKFGLADAATTESPNSLLLRSVVRRGSDNAAAAFASGHTTAFSNAASAPTSAVPLDQLSLHIGRGKVLYHTIMTWLSALELFYASFTTSAINALHCVPLRSMTSDDVAWRVYKDATHGHCGTGGQVALAAVALAVALLPLALEAARRASLRRLRQSGGGGDAVAVRETSTRSAAAWKTVAAVAVADSVQGPFKRSGGGVAAMGTVLLFAARLLALLAANFVVDNTLRSLLLTLLVVALLVFDVAYRPFVARDVAALHRTSLCALLLHAVFNYSSRAVVDGSAAVLLQLQPVLLVVWLAVAVVIATRRYLKGLRHLTKKLKKK